MNIQNNRETVVGVSNLFCRMVLGSAFIAVAAGHVLQNEVERTGDLCAATLPGADVIIPLLLMSTGAWMLFGIYTRIMTLMGVSLFFAFEHFVHCVNAFSPEPWDLTNALLVFALPLLFYGGGSFSLLRRGWNLPI